MNTNNRTTFLGKRVFTPEDKKRHGYFLTGYTWRDTVAIVTYIVAQFVLAIIFAVVATIYYMGQTKDTDVITDLVTRNPYVVFGPFIPILIALLFIYKRELKVETIDFWKRKWKIIGIAVAAMIIGAIGGELYSALVSFVLGSGGSAGSQNQEIIENSSSAAPWLFFISVVIIAPIIEEIIFRKILFTHLGNSVNYILSTILSVLIFAGIHVIGELLSGEIIAFALVFPVYLIMSIMMTGANYFSKNIYGSIITHMLNNLVAALFILHILNF